MSAPSSEGPFRGRFRRTDFIVEAVVALLIIVLVLADSGHPAPKPDVTLTLSRSPLVRRVPARFLGLSMEYTSVERYAGENPAAINPVFRRLIANLSPGQAPVIRIGGDSTDRTWWPVNGMSTPPWAKLTLGSRWVSIVRALAEGVGGRLILGLNLEANSSTIAQTEANALLAGFGSRLIDAFELGNEPELYGRFGWYRTSAGARVTGRPRSYSYSDYVSDVSNISSALPTVPLAGPAWGNFSWTSNLGDFLAGQPRLRAATLHRYPLQRCFERPGAARYPTIANLLQRASSTGLAARFGAFAAVAHARGIPFRLDELNTVSCGADRAVSHSFASALWVVDALFALVHAGVDAVNIHTFPEAGYNLFSFAQNGGKWEAAVWPEYYGLLLFAQAAPPGARLLEVEGLRPSALRAWATVGRDGRVRVVLVNEDPGHSHVVAIRGAGLRAPASLMRLQGASLSAQSGVSLGGEGYGERTTSGVLEPHPERVGASGGKYTVVLPAASAALLTIGG